MYGLKHLLLCESVHCGSVYVCVKECEVVFACKSSEGGGECAFVFLSSCEKQHIISNISPEQKQKHAFASKRKKKKKHAESVEEDRLRTFVSPE